MMNFKEKINKKIQAYANIFGKTYMHTKTEGAAHAWKQAKEVNN